MANRPVFFDATGRRAARISILGWLAAIVSTVLGIVFIASLLIAQPAPNVDLPGRPVAINPPQLVRQAVAPGLLKSAARLAEAARMRRLEIQNLRRIRNASPPHRWVAPVTSKIRPSGASAATKGVKRSHQSAMPSSNSKSCLLSAGRVVRPCTMARALAKGWPL